VCADESALDLRLGLEDVGSEGRGSAECARMFSPQLRNGASLCGVRLYRRESAGDADTRREGSQFVLSC
jgi:hypothetical protein